MNRVQTDNWNSNTGDSVNKIKKNVTNWDEAKGKEIQCIMLIIKNKNLIKLRYFKIDIQGTQSQWTNEVL